MRVSMLAMEQPRLPPHLHLASAMLRRVAQLALPAVILVAVQSSHPASAEELHHRRFLLIFAQQADLAANIEARRGANEAFGKALDAGYELYSEFRDSQRFPGAEEDRLFAEEMALKYRGEHFDAILAFGGWALDYALANRAALGIDAPVVFGGVSDATLAGRALPADAHRVSSRFSIAGTVELARRMQPQARRIVAMAGSGPFDRTWEPRVRAELAGVDGLELEFVSGLTLEGFQGVAASLDPTTILLILTIFEDATGRNFTPVNAAELIAARSGAPAWSVYDTYVGRGIVGGVVQPFHDIGAAVAEQALKLGDGDPEGPAQYDVPAQAVLDWRQMRRFGLDQTLIPAGARLEFYQPSVWERYRLQILLAVGVLLTQSATIAALVVQGRRKRVAQQELIARRSELAHVSRVAQLGELSGAMAHELNQPLTSILANAEAGAHLLARAPVDLEELAAILADIAEDDRRAAEIIADLRRLMTRGGAEFAMLDLDRLAEAAMRLIQSELMLRGVRVDHRPAREPIPVRANGVQIKQVLINLMLNAADAMAGQRIGTRSMTITTRLRDDGWREVSVRDNGPGLEPALGDPFRPFATTKADGLGLGLSICRTIARSHGGTLIFDPQAQGGACVILALPPP